MFLMKTTRANKATDTQVFETERRWRVKLANGFAYAMGKSAKEAMEKASAVWGERAVSAKVSNF